jgi:hypothetical protein
MQACQSATLREVPASGLRVPHFILRGNFERPGSGVRKRGVEELLEEVQLFEAEVVRGVENARPADEGGVRTHEVPEDDVPEEYEDQN